MNFGSGKPIYQQVYEQYAHLIEIGALKKGDPLPSVRDVAESLGINPNTVQRAYVELQKNGYIRGLEKKGNIVCYDPEGKVEKESRLHILLDGLISQGYSIEEIKKELERIEKGEKKNSDKEADK